MIELPEAVCLAQQLNETIKGKKITEVIAGQSPHSFAFYYRDPKDYAAKLRGKTIESATSHGGLVEVKADDTIMLFGDGANLRYHKKSEKRPPKHQLLLEFADGAALSVSIQMYGGIWCFKEGEFDDNKYYAVARAKPSPLSDAFDRAYFASLINAPDVPKLSVKAFLATEQRIPGLGNGVLQDILYSAGIHPKQKMANLTESERKNLYNAVKSTLKEMTAKGGRDVNKDLFGQPGGYQTRLSQLTLNRPCPVCGGRIIKQAYLGGSIYFCQGCQKI